MRRWLLIIIACACAGWIAAGEPMRVQYRLSGTAGWLNRDDKIGGTATMKGLSMDRPVVLGGTAAVEFLPTNRLPHALQQWNNASIGVAATYLNLGQDRYLGNAVATWTYLSIPLVHTPHFIFGVRPGVGLAFADRRYSNTVPDAYRWQAYQVGGEQVANISIGSVVNAFINGGLYMDFPIRNGWSVTLAGGWQHMSNGSVLTPNAGYNMFNAELGVAYTPYATDVAHETPASDVPHGLWDGVEDAPTAQGYSRGRWDIELSAMGGARSVYYRDRSVAGNTWMFGVADVSLAAHWIPLSIFKVGVGVDMFYDGAYAAVCDEFSGTNPDAPQTWFGKTYLSESRVDNCFRVGVSLQPELTVGRLSVGYHVGLYLLDPVKNLEPYKEVQQNGGKPLDRGIIYAYDPSRASTYQDGWCYQRLTLKYHVTDHLFVQLGLKLHIMKAEFVAAGLGVSI